MDGGFNFVGMAVKTAGLQSICDDLIHRPAGRSLVVDVTGRFVAGGTGAAIGWDIMQGLYIVHVCKRPMTVVTESAWLFLGQVGWPDGNAMCGVAAYSAVNMAIEIGRMTACTAAGTTCGVAPASAATFEGAIRGDIGVAVGAEVLVGVGAGDLVACVADDATCCVGDAVMVFTLMAILEVGSIGAVARPAVGRGANGVG